LFYFQIECKIYLICSIYCLSFIEIYRILKEAKKYYQKIINDPVYGFINIPSELVFNIIEHPYFQRLRRIKQLGLTFYVYPGTTHTRFQHAVGSMHLMKLAIEVIKHKGHEISEEEAQSAMIAILLHDIGHGPFSHSLERIIIDNIDHEFITGQYFVDLNNYFDNKLENAIKIFNNQYHKKYLHQLISSQLDVDRLDYLRRDSFFSGVSEGIIGSDRIIKMLNVVDNELVIEEKGIYSVEKYLIARRFMYWQVYLHKAVLSAEIMIAKILMRAKELAQSGEKLFSIPEFSFLLENKISKNDFEKTNSKSILEIFSKLDDSDVFSSIKVWSDHKDKILSDQCKRLINRRLFKVEISNTEFMPDKIDHLEKLAMKKYGISKNDVSYYVFSNKLSNSAYNLNSEKINVIYKSGKLVDFEEASDMQNLTAFSKNVVKHFLYYPKDLI